MMTKQRCYGGPGKLLIGGQRIPKVRPFRVLMISSSFYPRIDGTTRVVSDLCKELRRHGQDVTLLTRWYPRLPRSDKSWGFEVLRVGTNKRSGSALYFTLVSVLEALRITRERGFVVHAHGTLPALVATIVKFFRRVDFAVTFHQDNWSTRGALNISLRTVIMTAIQIWASRNARFIIAQSEYVLNLVKLFLRMKNSEKFRIIPNGVDLERFSSGGVTLAQDHPIIAVVSRLGENKGVDVRSEEHTS